MVERVLCPVLIRRDEELAVLEDALLAAHRGESRFVMVAGDAGMGKTRLATGLAGSARQPGAIRPNSSPRPIARAGFSDAMRRADELWAEVRNAGQPTAANAALDGDVILAAQAIVAFATSAVIATSNVAHLNRFVRAELWSDI